MKRLVLGVLVASGLMLLSLSGCALPQSQGQARYDVLVVEVPARSSNPLLDTTLGTPHLRDWVAIKVDRSTGETWMLGSTDGRWHPIATAPASAN